MVHVVAVVRLPQTRQVIKTSPVHFIVSPMLLLLLLLFERRHGATRDAAKCSHNNQKATRRIRLLILLEALTSWSTLRAEPEATRKKIHIFRRSLLLTFPQKEYINN